MKPDRAALMRGAALLAAALWWGSLTATAFWIVPLLFRTLPSPAMAGATAARLFAVQNLAAALCGGVLLLFFGLFSLQAGKKRAFFAMFFVSTGLVLAALSEWVIAPHIIARDRLALWHSLGTLAYFGQWLVALIALASVPRFGQR